ILRELYREESKQSELLKLPENFYQKLEELINESNINAKKSQDLQKLIEYKNILSTAEALVDIRIRKIIRLTSLLDEESTKKKSLTNEEQVFAEKLIKIIKEFKAARSFMNKELNRPHNYEIEVHILQDIPEYIGKDGKIYGPYQKNSIVKLPYEEAEYLIKENFAQEKR
ncbi:MAG: hypothetical protein QW076_06075, partial [Candidatus Anstonellales archaeon]